MLSKVLCFNSGGRVGRRVGGGGGGGGVGRG